MSEEGGEAMDFVSMREDGRRRKASNRAYSTSLLMQRGVRFDSCNDGLHLVVRDAQGRRQVDFWPSTGLWIPVGTGRRQRGVNALLRYLGKAPGDTMRQRMGGEEI